MKKVKDKQQKTISNAFSTKKVPYSGIFLSFEMIRTKIYTIWINFQKVHRPRNSSNWKHNKIFFLSGQFLTLNGKIRDTQEKDYQKNALQS